MLDESVPKRLAQALRSEGFDVSAFPDQWKGAKNGRLLSFVEEAGFDCLLTCDRNLRFQQTIASRQTALVVLPRQRFDDLLPYLDEIGRILSRIQPGQVAVLDRMAEG